MNLPNQLTVFRIIIIPIFVVFMLYTQWDYSYAAAGIIFILASATDYLDGCLARKYNQVTNFGKFLDPMADKLLVLSAMICLGEHGLCSPAVIIVVLARELMVSSLRLVAASQSVIIAAGKMGKIKTASQMISIVVVILMMSINQVSAMNLPVQEVSNCLMLITAGLALVSGAEYLYKNRKIIDVTR